MACLYSGLALSGVALGGSALGQWTPPDWKYEQVGEFSDWTLQQASVRATDGRGLMVGDTRPGNGTELSQRAWVWERGEGLTRLGLTDALHTSSTGVQISESIWLGAEGSVIGHSAAFDGTQARGQSAWVWKREAGTSVLGFDDAAHTGVTGQRFSSAVTVNGVGSVVGASTQYVNGAEAGASAWIWTRGQGTRAIGLRDGEHVRADGAWNATPALLTDGNCVAGVSERFAAGGGQSAWVWGEESGTRAIGLEGGAYRRADGARWAAPDAMSANGVVAGRSRRYEGMRDRGEATWAWTPSGGAERIGFWDGVFTNSYGADAGAQRSGVTAVNAGGTVIGYSENYASSYFEGGAAWKWTAGRGTESVGLAGPEFTSAEGLTGSAARAISDSGYIAGNSAYYDGGFMARGSAAWVTSPSGDMRTIGLTDSEYLDPVSGRTRNRAWDVNESGSVVGFSSKADLARPGMTFSVPWYFDQATGLTYPLEFSVRADGYSNTSPHVLTDSGVVLGAYDLYDGMEFEGWRGFIWSVANGFADIGELSSPGMYDSWISTGGVSAGSSEMLIAGQAQLRDLRGGAYALYVPAPGVWAAMGLAAGWALPCGKRRARRA